MFCGLKVETLILGLQLGYSKFYCFLCKWDSRARADHYIKPEWPKRQSLGPCVKNMIHVGLVEHSKILLPSLHIKLGLMKNFVKALDRDGAAFKYLISKFPKLNLEKIKASVFVGLQIRELVVNIQFDNNLEDEKTA